MKKIVLLCIAISLWSEVNATTRTWVGMASNNIWDNDTNWTPLGKPALGDDVIVPTGFNVLATGFYCYMKTFRLLGNSTLLIDQNFQVTDSGLVEPNAILNWNSGELNGGGKIRNKGTINLINTTTGLAIAGFNVIDNEGTINFPIVNTTPTAQTVSLQMNNATINNLATGIIDIKSQGNTFSVQTGILNKLNNWGLIKKTGGSDPSFMAVVLRNYPNGVIQVDSGSMHFINSTDTLDGGIYNVAAGARLVMNNETYYFGSLTGILNGEFVLKGTIRVPTAMSFDFTGPSNIVWETGTVYNGGTITNNSKLMLNTDCAGCAIILGGNTLINNGEITMVNHDLFIPNGRVNNTASGIININDNAALTKYTGASLGLYNYGLIRKSTGAGSANIELDTVRNMGILECTSGTIKLPGGNINNFINYSNGIIQGTGAYELLFSNYRNQGITSPGGNAVDTLWINNNTDYHTTDSSTLDVQLNGTNQGVTYDYLYITNGYADFAGKVKVTLGYAPALTDTFIVAKCAFSITSCTIDSTTTATFGTNTYTFRVECVYNNALKLSLISILPTGIEENKIAAGISLFPNPTDDVLAIKIESNSDITGIEIFNTKGQKIDDRINLKSKEVSVSIAGYEAGIYITKIYLSNGSTITKRVAKQ